jgi:hypothetical protein
MTASRKHMKVWPALVGLLISCAAPAGEDEGRDPWRDFDLGSARVKGVALRYERSLAGELDAIKSSLSDLMKTEAQGVACIASLRGKSDGVIERVNRIVGFSPGEKEKGEQRKVLLGFLDTIDKTMRLTRPGRKLTVYVVTRKTSKDYLRKGGKLPGFTYDRAKDLATYEFEIRGKVGSGAPPGDVELVLPVAAEDAGKEVGAILARAGRMRSWTSAGMAVHELAEITMLAYRLKPLDPYFRWFSDGFANAITIHVLREFFGEPAAAEFAEAFDTSGYVDLEKQINLLYWMGLDFCVKTPLESESRLEHARYNYATREALGLIGRHGIGCVARILEKACKSASGNDSRNLISAVKEVTGEDVEKRFLRYQSFRTKAEGLKRYAAAFSAAVGRKDYAEALPALLRIHELRGMVDPRIYGNVAQMLFRMGHEAAGDRAILDHAELCKRRGMKEAHVAMHALFIDHALRCRNLKKAVPSAEVVLKARPDCVPALAVRMLKLGTAGRIDEAKALARRILKLDREPKSPWRQLAEKALKAAPAGQTP